MSTVGGAPSFAPASGPAAVPGHPTHVGLEGRVGPDLSAFSDGQGTEDCHGHGTHVAGTVGAGAFGAAKDVTLVPVRVLDCNGSGLWSAILAVIDYVTRDTARRPALANMSRWARVHDRRPGGAELDFLGSLVRRGCGRREHRRLPAVTGTRA